MRFDANQAPAILNIPKTIQTFGPNIFKKFQMPKVSVVIPTYNRRDKVVEALESVLRQTHQDMEIVVVDDGGSDGTPERIAKFFSDNRLRVISQPNLGASAARNRGAAETSGEWLAFLDSDDLWLEDKIQKQLEAMEKHPESPACYTEEIWFRRGVRVNPGKIHAKFSGWIFDRCLPLCIISPSSIMIKRKVFELLGGFDESFPACEDYDLWLRLSARHPIHLLDEQLIVKRNGHEGQLSAIHFGQDRFRIKALWKITEDDELPIELKRQALELIASKSKIMSDGAKKRGKTERAEVFSYSRREALRRLDNCQQETFLII